MSACPDSWAIVRDVRNHHGDLLPVLLREYTTREMAEAWAEGHVYQYPGMRLERWEGIKVPVVVKEFAT